MVTITSIQLSGILAIIVGLLILVWPKIIRWAIGLYLIIAGLLQVLNLSI